MKDKKSNGVNKYPFYKDTSKKMIAGVCAGIADYFEIDVFVVRVCFVFMGVIGFAGIALYVVLMYTLPDKKDLKPEQIMKHKYKSFEEKQYVQAQDRKRRSAEYRAKREKERLQMENWEHKQKEDIQKLQKEHKVEAETKFEKKQSMVNDFNSYLDKVRTSEK